MLIEILLIAQALNSAAVVYLLFRKPLHGKDGAPGKDGIDRVILAPVATGPTIETCSKCGNRVARWTTIDNKIVCANCG